MDLHRTKCKLFLIYAVMGLRIAILRFLCIPIPNTFFMLKILKIQIKGKNYCKKSVFAMKKVLIHKNLKIATLRRIST